jgi:predicted DsbA family dithiol-disulfide isomerase
MAKSEKTSLKLEIYSDVICPWCYVGKARLDKALQSLSSDLAVDVEWMPFELNPSMPDGGMDRKEYLMKKFGSSDVSQMQERLNAAGSPDGLQFNFGGIKVVPNTFSAHRLLWFAKSSGKQHKLSDILFRNYFTDGLDIGDLKVLVSAAAEAGLSADDARKFLNSDDGSAEVKAEKNVGDELDIHAVPTFVLGGHVVASGAIAAAELTKLLEKAAGITLARTP